MPEIFTPEQEAEREVQRIQQAKQQEPKQQKGGGCGPVLGSILIVSIIGGIIGAAFALKAGAGLGCTYENSAEVGALIFFIGCGMFFGGTVGFFIGMMIDNSNN